MADLEDVAGNYSKVFFVNDTTDFHISPNDADKRFKDVRDSIYVQTPYPDYKAPEIDVNNILKALKNEINNHYSTGSVSLPASGGVRAETSNYHGKGCKFL